MEKTEEPPKEDPKKDIDSSDEISQNIIDFLNEKWPSGSQKCPICGHDSWLIMDTIYELSETPPKGSKVHKVFPVGVLMCDTCGYILSFNYIFIKNFLKMKRKVAENKTITEGEKNGSN